MTHCAGEIRHGLRAAPRFRQRGTDPAAVGQRPFRLTALMQSQSIWLAAGQPAAFAPLAGSRTADVAIVGGGITGVLCAQALAQEGADVVLVESGRVGEGSTGNSTGNLYALVGERRHRIDHDHACWLARARADAIDRIENLVRTHEIDCGFVRCPWVLYSESDPASHAIERAREFMSSAE